MAEIKIGETFRADGRVLIVKEGDLDSCRKCAFYGNMVPIMESCWKYPCIPSGRHDGKMVYYEEVKDGGKC